MVKVTVQGDEAVMLANDNLADSGSPDSLIHAIESPGDYINEVMKGKDISALAAIVASAKEHDRQQELAAFRRDPNLAQRKAIALYPDLAVAGSDLNKKFIARMKRYQAEKKDFFTDPDWPLRLAKECSDDLSAKSAQK